MSRESRCTEGKGVSSGRIYFVCPGLEDNTKEQVKETIQSYQKQSDIPMLIGVDEEGGTVNRISRYPAFRAEPFSSPQELYKAGGFEAIEKDTAEKCTLLHELGVNLNFALYAMCQRIRKILFTIDPLAKMRVRRLNM